MSSSSYSSLWKTPYLKKNFILPGKIKGLKAILWEILIPILLFLYFSAWLDLVGPFMLVSYPLIVSRQKEEIPTTAIKGSLHSFRKRGVKNFTNYLSLDVSIRNYLFLSVTICYYLYLYITICYYLLLSVSIYYYLLLSVTICYYLLLSVTFWIGACW